MTDRDRRRMLPNRAEASSMGVFAGHIRVHVRERAAWVGFPGPHVQLVEQARGRSDWGVGEVEELAFLKDEAPDIKRPQAVMYEPVPNGKMELVAVEYIKDKLHLRSHRRCRLKPLSSASQTQINRRSNP